MKGPETVVFNSKDGTLHVLTEEALLVSLTDFQTEEKKNDDTEQATIQTAKATVVADLGMGRPLGGRFTPDGKTIYIADSLLGLIRVHEPNKFPQSKVELVANKVMDEGALTRILYANDVTIGPKTGKVYFTDCTLQEMGFRRCSCVGLIFVNILTSVCRRFIVGHFVSSHC